LLANATARSAASLANADTFSYGGESFVISRQANPVYCIANGRRTQTFGSLVDSGANGGLAGRDVHILEEDLTTRIDVTGVADQTLHGLANGQCARVAQTIDDGPVVLIMSQYAISGEGKTIHSKTQLEYFGNLVHDSSRRSGGRQCIVTREGYVFRLHVREGLSYFDMVPPTDAQLEDLPHIFLTSDAPWDPSVIHNKFHDTEFNDYVLVNNPEAAERPDAHGIRQPTDHAMQVNYYDVLRAVDEVEVELDAVIDAAHDINQQLDDAFEAAVAAELQADWEEDHMEERVELMHVNDRLSPAYEASSTGRRILDSEAQFWMG
jgi:hypothetical protein